ncbi:MAG: histidine phosphatase family protein [Deltaproteobacteria bacterium]|nr:histidine phosphatase family protein [Deltaproteobacteria bacterium]
MGASPILFLARHGETDWNAAGRWQGQTDIPLNERGREQARAIANRLRGEGVSSIASSDLLRARTTAEIVATELRLEVNHVHGDLRERAFGCFEGLTGQEVAAQFPEAWARYLADPEPAPPGGESRQALLARLLPAVLSAAARLEPPLLVVMHGGAMRALLAGYLGSMPRPASAAWPLHGIQNGQVYRVNLAGGKIAGASRIDAAG